MIRQKSGFTLMELLVYMSLLSAIVLIAGRAFSDSTKFRVRTQNMLRATQEAENVAVLLKSDISQMGAKSSVNAGAPAGGVSVGDNFSLIYDSVYIAPAAATKDSSSFLLISTENSDFDSLFIRYVRYDNQGHFVAVEEAHWYVEANVLKRACRTLAGEPDTAMCKKETRASAKDHAVTVASGVRQFKVLPARPSALVGEEQLFPPSGGDEFRLVPRKNDEGYANLYVANESGIANSGGTGQRLGGSSGPFFSNYDNANQQILTTGQKVNELIAIDNDNSDSPWRSLCAVRGGNYNGRIRLLPKTEYELSFNMPLPSSNTDRSLLFVPGKDHMSVGFRSYETGEPPKKGEGTNTVQLIDDFMFFPPLDANRGDGRRVMRFTVPDTIDKVCISFTFACYSPLVSQGSLTIEKLKLRKVPTANYDFQEGYTPNDVDKKNIKAMKVFLQVARGGKNGHKGEADSLIVVVPTPSNGPRD